MEQHSTTLAAHIQTACYYGGGGHKQTVERARCHDGAEQKSKYREWSYFS